MKYLLKTFDCLIFFPALIGWIIFAPSFRIANKIAGANKKYSIWFWCGIEAKCHETYYDAYDEA